MKNLHEGEEVLMVIRRHWIAFVFLAIYFLGAVFFTALIFGILGYGVLVILGMIIFWMFYAMFLYTNWINYELDLFVITNNRVLTIEQVSFLNRAVGETTLDKVQEANVETKGLLANLFDFGTLTIVTAGGTKSFDMTYSPKPMENSRIINNICMKYRDSLFGNPNHNHNQKQVKTVNAKVERAIKGGLN